MALNPFTEYYLHISDAELLDVLENKEDYQPLAIEAALAEWERRQLSQEDILAAREIMTDKMIREERAPVKVIQKRASEFGKSFFDTINPVIPGIATAERIIRFLVILFAGVFIYNLTRQYRSYAIILDFVSYYPIVIFEYFLLPLTLAVAVFKFWQRRSSGWFLLTFYLVYGLGGRVYMFIQSLTWRSSGFEVVDSWLPRPNPLAHLPGLIFWTASILVVCRKDVREVFSIDNRRMFNTFTVSALFILAVTVLTWLSL